MNRGGGPSSWAHQLLGLSIVVLLAALALHWAVQLLREIWLPLLGGVLCVAVVGAAVTYYRNHNSNW